MAKFIFTTYMAKAKYLPDNIQKIYVCRFLPVSKGFQISDPSSIEFSLRFLLSPKANNLIAYKKGELDFDDLISSFKSDIHAKVGEIYNRLEECPNTEICFICFEKDVNKCHRKPLAEILDDHFPDYIYMGEYKYED